MNQSNNLYRAPNPDNWIGRSEQSSNSAYWHQIVQFADTNSHHLDWSVYKNNSTVFIGYKCDEGVKRNQGRVGAVAGPKCIRKMLGGLPNNGHSIVDAGDVVCMSQGIEPAQHILAERVEDALNHNLFPLLLGGGHDISYGHYKGIRQHLDKVTPKASIGIINLDAHFDLRSNEFGNNSGTPFYQIATDCTENNHNFNYLCLGIQRSSNTSSLFDTAESLGVEYVLSEDFHIRNVDHIEAVVSRYINSVDVVYLTIDLDGFSSAYAPGVSAPSPLGFYPDIALLVIKMICSNKKLISADVAELNPTYDIDGHTARLAAKLIHYICSNRLPIR